MLESVVQATIIKDLERLFPGCVVMKQDAGYRQGIPDLLVLFGNQWAVLEVKASYASPYRPNQEWWLDTLSTMSFSAMICPENKDEVLESLYAFFR